LKAWKALSIVALVLVWSAAALGQDAVKVDPAHYKIVFENASVRVLKIGYARQTREHDLGSRRRAVRRPRRARAALRRPVPICRSRFKLVTRT
jgi:hypothetical protein